MKTVKKIGFIDFFIDEWHANNYPDWIRADCTASGRDFELSYVWAETVRPSGLDTAAWGEKFGMTPLSSIEEVVEKSDCIILLSPDNPENHERLAQLPLQSGKPLYVDKTFSPDLATGGRMFELAEKHNTPMFSSSALRYATEFASYPDGKVNPQTLEYVATQGPGAFENYSVHQLEMIVSLMGPGVKQVKALTTPHARTFMLEYIDGRRAMMNQQQEVPFQAALQLKSGEGIFTAQCSDIFPRLIHSMLDFFETRTIPVPKAETLDIMAVLEAGHQAIKHPDSWIPVPKV